MMLVLMLVAALMKMIFDFDALEALEKRIKKV